MSAKSFADKLVRDAKEYDDEVAELKAKLLASEAQLAKYKATTDLNKLVDRFLTWDLPKSVCVDSCATEYNYPFTRTGTALLTADEAKQMFQHVLSPSANPGQEDM